MGKSLKGKELGKGICQRKDGRYQARFTINGKRYQKCFNKLSECRNWIAEEEQAAKNAECYNPYLTVDELYEYWINIKKETVKYNTTRNYSERYRINIKDNIGVMKVVDVKPFHIQNIFLEMREKGYKTSTMNQTRITLYNLFSFACEYEYIIVNPVKKSVKSDIGEKSKEIRSLTREEQKLFISHCRWKSYGNQYRFILQTGLRTGELIGLKWSDIDFHKKTLTVKRSMEYRYKHGWREGPPKSKSGYRVIPLTDEAIKILHNQLKKNSMLPHIENWCEDIIFLCRKGTPVKNSTYDTAIYKMCEAIGIEKFSMHILRHTFATRCIEGGMKPKTLQVILGHSNINITMNIYVHITEEEKSEEILKIQNVLMA